MGIKIETTFDDYFETIFLLINTQQVDAFKEQVVKELNHLGMAGEKIFTEHLSDWQQMLAYFSDTVIKNEEFPFFFNQDKAMTDDYYITIGYLVTDFKDAIKEAENEEAMRSLFPRILIECNELEYPTAVETTEDFFQLLEHMNYSEREKWQFMAIYQRAHYYLNQLIELVEMNIPNYKKAYQQYDISKMIENYVIELQKDNNRYTKVLNQLSSADCVVYPTLANPLAQILWHEKCFVGLLILEIFQDDNSQKPIDDQLLMSLKALADKSKLQILLSLKESPKYNLELAEALELSPGTMSHHMNNLLTAELVKVEKRGSKVYYMLDEESLQRILDKLQTLLF